MVQAQNTSIEIDNPVIGGMKVSSDNDFMVLGIVFIFAALVGFFIYAKYFHKRVREKIRLRRERRK